MPRCPLPVRAGHLQDSLRLRRPPGRRGKRCVVPSGCPRSQNPPSLGEARPARTTRLQPATLTDLGTATVWRRGSGGAAIRALVADHRRRGPKSSTSAPSRGAYASRQGRGGTGTVLTSAPRAEVGWCGTATYFSEGAGCGRVCCGARWRGWRRPPWAAPRRTVSGTGCARSRGPSWAPPRPCVSELFAFSSPHAPGILLLRGPRGPPPQSSGVSRAGLPQRPSEQSRGRQDWVMRLSMEVH